MLKQCGVANTAPGIYSITKRHNQPAAPCGNKEAEMKYIIDEWIKPLALGAFIAIAFTITFMMWLDALISKWALINHQPQPKS